MSDHGGGTVRVPPLQRAEPRPDELESLTVMRPRAFARAGGRHLARIVGVRPWAFSAALVGAVVFVAGVFATSVVVGRVTDEVLVPVLGGGTDPDGLLLPAVVAVLGVAVWRALGIVLRRGGAGWAQSGVVADLRRRLVAHQLGLSLRWYGRQRVGDLLAVNDAHVRVASQVIGPLPYSLGAIALTVGAGLMVLALDPVLGGIVVALLVATVTAELVAAWRTFAAFDLEQHRKSLVARVAHESIDGAQTIAALGIREEEVSRFATHVGAQRDAEVLVGNRWSWFRSMMEVVPSLVTVPVVVVGALRVEAGALTVGELVTVAYLLSLLSIPVAIVGFLVWDTAHSLTGWSRLEAVLQAQDRLSSGPEEVPARGPAEAEVDEVSFAYDSDVPALHDLTLALRPGSTVALVGPTASGKSTLIALLARLWDPSDGAVRLDGHDLRDVDDATRTAQVALVGQEAFVFDDTVRGNVLLGHEAADDEVWAALEAAEAGAFVRALPQGLETLLGERGASLSGGQRQRLALARALVRRPRLLLLDDATSAVDPSVESRILARLREAERPTTVLLVAARPSSIALCDEVVLLDGGRVAATGPHERLLREVPAYATLLQAYERERDRRAAGGGAAS